MGFDYFKGVMEARRAAMIFDLGYVTHKIFYTIFFRNSRCENVGRFAPPYTVQDKLF